MKTHEHILERAQRCNPVPWLETIHESDLAELDSLLEQRRSAPAASDTSLPLRELDRMLVRKRARIRPVLVIVAAAVVMVAAVGIVTLFTGDPSGVVEQPPTTALAPPPTSADASPQPTAPPPTSSPPTTAVEPIVPGPPVVDENIGDIAFDSTGDAWVAGDETLYRLSDGAWTTVPLPRGFAYPGALHAGSGSSMWITADEGGIARYENGEWTRYIPPEIFEYKGDLVYAGGGCGPDIAVGPTGDVWAICPDILMRLDDGELVPVEIFDELWDGWYLLAGPEGMVYHTGIEELRVFDGTTWSAHDCNAPGPSLAQCTQLLGADSTGHVWVALGFDGFDGLVRFATPGYEPEVLVGWAHGATDMAETADGALWFAVPEYDEWDLGPEHSTVPEAGLYRFDGVAWRRYTTADGLNSNSVARVEVAPDGTLWVGTSIRVIEIQPDGTPRGGNVGGGIDVYDPVTDRFAPHGGGS